MRGFFVISQLRNHCDLCLALRALPPCVPEKLLVFPLNMKVAL